MSDDDDGEPVVTVPGGVGPLMGTTLPGPGTAASVNPALTWDGRAVSAHVVAGGVDGPGREGVADHGEGGQAAVEERMPYAWVTR
jgi:hypothetical protein